MAIGGLFDSQVRIWRPTETRGAYRAPDDDYDPVTTPTRPNACMEYPGGTLVNEGAGEKDISRRRWYLDRSCDVRERDVLEVIAGPRVGSRWRVDGEPDKPSGGPRNSGAFHHWEAWTVPWKGRLPLDTES
jgi:hypothetical protein